MRSAPPARARASRSCRYLIVCVRGRARSGDRYFLLVLEDGAVVVEPRELERPRLRNPDRKGKIRVRRNRGMPIAVKNFLAVELGRERLDDLARDRLALRVLALTAFHFVRDQRFHFYDLAGFGLARHTNAGCRFYHDVSSEFSRSSSSRRIRR